MKKQAFTLVELIVVITILAILSTISFITLSGYSKEARDSKRITDTSSILSKINIEFVKGEKLSSLIIKDKDNNLTIKSSSNPGFQGIPNYEVLKEDYKNFRDPTNNQIYPFAYTIGGTGSGAYTFMQMATVSESEGRARLMGNYFKFEDNDSPSLFTSSGTTGTNIPGDYLEDNGIELPYNIGMQVAPLICNTGYQEVNNKCEPIICSSGSYLVGNTCINQWSGDATNGYIFKTSTGAVVYPTSCNNLLTDNQFKVGTTGAYNGTKFNDGIYYIKPNSNPAFKAYCDMTNNSGGWTLVLRTLNNSAGIPNFITQNWGNNPNFTEVGNIINLFNGFSQIKVTIKNSTQSVTGIGNFTLSDLTGTISKKDGTLGYSPSAKFYKNATLDLSNNAYGQTQALTVTENGKYWLSFGYMNIGRAPSAGTYPRICTIDTACGQDTTAEFLMYIK